MKIDRILIKAFLALFLLAAIVAAYQFGPDPGKLWRRWELFHDTPAGATLYPAIFLVMFFFAGSLLYMLQKPGVRTRALGRREGWVLYIPADDPRRERTLPLLEAYDSGRRFDRYRLLKKPLFAEPARARFQPFLVTGWYEDEEGALDLLGHCTEIKRAGPDEDAKYKMLTRSEDRPRKLAAPEIDLYTELVYDKMSRDLDPLYGGDAYEAVVRWSQGGVWIFANDASRAELETYLGEMTDPAILVALFDAMFEAGFRLPRYRAWRELAHKSNFPVREQLLLESLKKRVTEREAGALEGEQAKA